MFSFALIEPALDDLLKRDIFSEFVILCIRQAGTDVLIRNLLESFTCNKHQQKKIHNKMENSRH